MAAVINTIYLHPPHTVRAEDEMNNEDSKKNHKHITRSECLLICIDAIDGQTARANCDKTGWHQGLRIELPDEAPKAVASLWKIGRQWWC